MKTLISSVFAKGERCGERELQAERETASSLVFREERRCLRSERLSANKTCRRLANDLRKQKTLPITAALLD